MAELLLLGAQVADVLVVREILQRHPVDDRETVALEPPVLGGIVGEQPHGGDAEVDEDLRADPVLARVGGEAELHVRLHRVVALVLQRVGAHLVAEADAATLVAAQVHDHAVALLGDRLLARSSCSPQSQRIDPNTSPVRHSECTRTSTLSLPATSPRDERDVLGAVEQRLEHVRGEVAVDRGDARLGNPAHELLAPAAVADQVGDRDDHEVVLGRETLEVGQARHRAVVVHDLREHARGFEAGEPGEVDRRPRCGRRG